MEISENFSYVGPKQNFDRDNYTTLAEMKAVSDKNMPSIFLATCEETGKLYIYKKTNTADSVSGKWRDATVDESAPKLTAEQISHLLYQFADLPTASTAGFPIENGTRLYNSTDKKIYVASVAQDGSITWKAETSVDSSGSGSGSGSGGSGGSSSNLGDSSSGDSGSGSGSEPGGSGSDPVTVASPVISIIEGNVTITCETTGATIYYTTDGNAPTTSSAAYTKAFTVVNDTTVKAAAVKDGVFSSTVSKTYTVSSSGSDTDTPVVEKDYSYHGFLNGSLEETESIHDEGIEISEKTVKTLTKEETTSKTKTCVFIATQAEEDAPGVSFMVYAYPAKFGELVKYNFGLGFNAIEYTFTKFNITIDGVAYYVYAQTEGSCPSAGTRVEYTFE